MFLYIRYTLFQSSRWCFRCMVGARHKHALNFASPVDNIVIIKKSTVFTTARQWRAFKCLLLRRFFNFLCTEKNCSSHHFNTFNKMTYTVHSWKKAHSCENWPNNKRTSSKCYQVIHYCLVEIFIWLWCKTIYPEMISLSGTTKFSRYVEKWLQNPKNRKFK